MSQKKEVKAAELAALTPDGVRDILSNGVKIVEVSLPLLKDLFNLVKENLFPLGGKNMPAGRLKRIEYLESVNELQKEVNKQLFAKIEQLEAALKSFEEGKS